VIFASGKDLKFNVRLVLAPGEVPPAVLGQAQIGRTAWLSPSVEKGADDLCFTALIDGESAEEAWPGARRQAA
jgi:type VI secretion system protein ImpH